MYISKIDVKPNGTMELLVKWDNGTLSLVDYEEFKTLYHEKVLAFYESRIIFPTDHVGTKIFKKNHKADVYDELKNK